MPLGPSEQDVHTGDEGLDEAQAMEAFLKRWEDAEEPSDRDDEEGEDEDRDETDDSESDNEDEGSDKENADSDQEDPEDSEDDDDDGEAPASEAADNMVVKLTVDGEEKQVSVKDLKRLYGQEASLTRKSQEVADAKKAAEAQRDRHVAGLQKMLEKAQARFKPYAEIDMLLASKQLDASEFAQLRKDAQAAFEDVKFLTDELDSLVQATEAERTKELRERAQEAIKTLKDPSSPHHIPNWSNSVYDEIRTFAISQGLDEAEVNSTVDPAAIKVLHMAMQFAKGKQVATKKKASVAPKKVLRSTKGSGSPKDAKAAGAMERLKKSGSTDDAMAAFLAKWS